jgi:ABC-2 type transport system permease protein
VRGFSSVFKRELFSLFVTPLAWVVMASFLLLQGFFFFFLIIGYASQQELVTDSGPVQAFFGQTGLLYFPLILVCPLLTMRALAEERKSGTIEALLTAPVGAAGVVLGKYAAAVVTYVAMWAPTALYWWLLSFWGELDTRIIWTGYLAVFLVGAGYLSIGTLTSAMTTSQLTAAVVAMVVILFLFAFGFVGSALEPGWTRDLADHVSVFAMMNEFSRGLIDSRRLVYSATVVALPLFITVRTVESWRWG